MESRSARIRPQRSPASRRGQRLLGLVAGIALGATGCSETPRGPDACEGLPFEAESVVLVMGDTIRRDRVGSYGGDARTPNLDRLAAAGARFDAITAPAPWTKPSIATLFTGLPPWQHGALNHPEIRSRSGQDDAAPQADVLSEELVTMAEHFQAAGFATGAFVSNPWLDARFGFAQGFDTYDESFARWDAPGAVVSSAAVRWLRERDAGQPFFLYVHYLDAHRPYPTLAADEVRAQLSELNADERTTSARRAPTQSAGSPSSCASMASGAGTRKGSARRAPCSNAPTTAGSRSSIRRSASCSRASARRAISRRRS